MAKYMSIPEEVDAIQLKASDADCIKQDLPCIMCPVCNVSQPYEEGDYRVIYKGGHIQVLDPAEFKARFKRKLNRKAGTQKGPEDCGEGGCKI